MMELIFVGLARIRAFFAGAREHRELDQEMETHVSLVTEENVRRGMSPAEARRQALLAIGNLATMQEDLHQRRGLPLIETAMQDVRYGWRSLRQNPGFTIAATLTLALGIGANTVMFSVVNKVFLQPLPFPESHRLVNVWRSSTDRPESRGIVSAPDFHDWEKQNNVFTAMALFDSAGKGYNLAGAQEPERVPGLRVSASLFDVLGVKPAIGRAFTRDEELFGKHFVVILSHALWNRRFGGDPSIIGKTVRMDGMPYTVVGVMPAGFDFDFFSGRNELWVPAGFDSGDMERGSNSFGACARLKPGVTIDQARAEMDTIGRRVAKANPEGNPNGTVAVTPMSELGVRGLRSTFVALFSLVGLVLLIACVNVANLVLARGAARQKEFAVRRALGAGQLRILGQLLTEGLLLSLLGALGGIAMAALSLRALTRILPNYFVIPLRRMNEIELDPWVFGFTLLLCSMTGIVFGLASALSVLRRDSMEPALREGRGRGGSARSGRLRYALVATEISLALAVLVGAGLMLESMSRLLRVDPGLDARNVLILGISLPQKVMYYSPPEKATFCRDLSERVGGVPGVLSASAISHLPIGGGNAGRAFGIAGEADSLSTRPSAAYGLVCPSYFKTMGIPMVAGREFQHEDTVSSPQVAIINEALAKRFFKDKDPLGARIKIGGVNTDNPWMTIVGVTRNVRHNGLDQETAPHFYRPYTQAGWPSMAVVVKTASAPVTFAPAVKRALLTIDPDQAASGLRTMDQVVETSLGSRRLPAMLLLIFGSLALVLAGVGISGVVGYSVAQRTQEIGIRVALGARRSDVLRLILRRSMLWATGGLAVGLGASYGVTRLLGGLLYGIQPMDPRVIASAAGLLAVVAMGASYVPARKAASVDPMIALRCE